MPAGFAGYSDFALSQLNIVAYDGQYFMWNWWGKEGGR